MNAANHPGARKRRRGCLICGRTETVEATDNAGKKYRGCAFCRLLTAAEIAALARPR